MDFNKYLPEELLLEKEEGEALIDHEIVMAEGLRDVKNFHPIIAGLSAKYPEFLFSMIFNHLNNTTLIGWKKSPHQTLNDGHLLIAPEILDESEVSDE